ncbi:MAG: hypothetical protein RL033_7393 [Pseudomonadota bacterium]|jgi:hypothetical protein
MTRLFSLLNLAVVGVIGSLSVPALAADTTPATEAAGSTSVSTGTGTDAGPPLLFGEGLKVGGYGGLDVAYTRMFGRDGVVVGGEGAVLINHRLALGLAGWGWSNPVDGPNAPNGDRQHFDTGYGGVTLRYSFYMDSLPVYMTVGTLVGAGAIDLTSRDHGDDDFESNDDEDVFAVVQPDISLHANLTRWMRVGLTAGYRFTSGVGQLGFTESDVDGFLVGGQLQFGSF